MLATRRVLPFVCSTLVLGFTLKSYLDQLKVGLLQLVRKIKLSLSSPLAIATGLLLFLVGWGNGVGGGGGGWGRSKWAGKKGPLPCCSNQLKKYFSETPFKQPARPWNFPTEVNAQKSARARYCLDWELE